MSIAVTCTSCREELKEPGAVVHAPPDKLDRAKEHHLCRQCYEYLKHLFDRMDGKNGQGR